MPESGRVETQDGHEERCEAGIELGDSDESCDAADDRER